MPHPALTAMDKTAWESLTREEFDEMFGDSAVKRTKYEGLQRNIRFVMGDDPAQPS